MMFSSYLFRIKFKNRIRRVRIFNRMLRNWRGKFKIYRVRIKRKCRRWKNKFSIISWRINKWWKSLKNSKTATIIITKVVKIVFSGKIRKILVLLKKSYKNAKVNIRDWIRIIVLFIRIIYLANKIWM